MQKIAIHGREVSDEVAFEIHHVLSILRAEGKEIAVSRDFGSTRYEDLFQGIPRFDRVEGKDQFDCFLSLGGDGTFLETVTYVGDTEIPILGINTGRLGFLAPISKDHIESALNKLFAGQYKYDPRSLIGLECALNLFEKNFALNEFAIMRKDTSSMIVITCYVDGDYLSSYWADGLMVSTPTGSTGYSLSCGGPIIMPQSENFIITPVSPHNLNVRPLVLSDQSNLRFEVNSRNTNFLVSLDSRSATVSDNVDISISRANFKVNMIQIEEYNFLETLRAKLSWGLDKRN